MKIVISVGKEFDLSVPMLRELAKRKGLPIWEGLPIYSKENKDGGLTLWTVDPNQQSDLFSTLDFLVFYEKNTWSPKNVKRDDPELVRLVEELKSGDDADRYSNLYIVNIPDDVEWEIDSIRGNAPKDFREYIVEKHRKWFARQEEE